MDERYLKLLSEKFPNAQAVITELINLRAILSLPKGTEHFVSPFVTERNGALRVGSARRLDGVHPYDQECVRSR